jgi:flagellar basal body-associated protein FliL
MTWVRAHWIAIVTAAVLFLVGIGIGAAGGSSESATETTTVTKTQVRNHTQQAVALLTTREETRRTVTQLVSIAWKSSKRTNHH